MYERVVTPPGRGALGRGGNLPMADNKHFVSEFGGGWAGRWILIVGGVYGAFEGIVAVSNGPSLAAPLVRSARPATPEFWIVAGALALLVIAVSLIAIWKRSRRRMLACLTHGDNFLHGASRLLAPESAPPDPSTSQNGAAPVVYTPDGVRDAVLAYITASRGKTSGRLRCMYLRPENHSTKKPVLVPCHYEGHNRVEMKDFRVGVEGGAIGEAFHGDRTIRSRSLRKDNEFSRLGITHRMRSVICIPITEPNDTGPSGVFCVSSDRRIRFSQIDERYYRLCAGVLVLIDQIAPLGQTQDEAP